MVVAVVATASPLSSPAPQLPVSASSTSSSSSASLAAACRLRSAIYIADLRHPSPPRGEDPSAPAPAAFPFLKPSASLLLCAYHSCRRRAAVVDALPPEAAMVVVIPAYRPSPVSIHFVVPDASILSSSFVASVLSPFVLSILVVVGLTVAIYTGATFTPQPQSVIDTTAPRSIVAVS
ncbi:hypothetical protein E2562_005271 [Oryza meyeriana var. granulata]|uniref:Uncharacterized protein n=1 Tax=Oryza meyeriana var. granulata TaxID=110450 RepID=A0A6G1EES6_9ORYZ|nr:hypothetical protein E2562_005271 [Oryza meyeriana var. granulata]